MILKKILLILIFFLSCYHMMAQDISFTQFYGNLIYLNPAFAGSAKQLRVSAGYRNQWGGFTSYTFSADMPVSAISSALAAHFFYDDMGTFSQQNYAFVYAYKTKLSRHYTLVSAIKPVYTRYQVNAVSISGLTPEQVQGTHNAGFDAGAGFLLYGRDTYAGFSADHLIYPFNPDINASGMKFTLHYGGFIDIKNSKRKNIFTISPAMLIQKQNIYNQVNIGTYFIINAFTTGFWFRMHYPAHVSSVILTAGYHGPNYRIGYSYDFPANVSNFLYFPAHEITATFYFDYFNERNKENKLLCPAF